MYEVEIYSQFDMGYLMSQVNLTEEAAIEAAKDYAARGFFVVIVPG